MPCDAVIRSRTESSVLGASKSSVEGRSEAGEVYDTKESKRKLAPS